VVAAQSGNLLGSLKAQGQIWSSPKLDGGLVYFGSDDGNIYAYDRETKTLKWRYATGAKVRSSAAFSTNAIFFSSDDGLLYALDKRSGKLKWKFNLSDKDAKRILPAGHAPWVFDYTKSSPVVDGDVLYIGSSDHHLYALSTSTGELKWSFKAGDRIRSTATFNDDLVFTSSWDGITYALNKQSGELVWQHTSQARIVSSPVIIGDNIIIGSRDTRIYALNTQQGHVVWEYKFSNGSWVESSAVKGENDDVFYIGSSDNKQLMKFDANTGKPLWSFNTKGWAWGTPTYNNGRVYLGATGTERNWTTVTRGFFAVDAVTGKEHWSYQPKPIEGYIHGGVFGSVAVNDGEVFVPDLDGHVYVFKM
jgi:outer membrane protein assembly factor BamB